MASLSDLTPREREILQFVLAGRTDRAIAAEFWITEKTVEFHLDRIYTKIGAHALNGKHLGDAAGYRG